MWFVEPCLTFTADRDGQAVTILVKFSHEAAPSRRFDEPRELAFPMGTDDLAQAVAAWKDELARFPPR